MATKKVKIVNNANLKSISKKFKASGTSKVSSKLSKTNSSGKTSAASVSTKVTGLNKLKCKQFVNTATSNIKSIDANMELLATQILTMQKSIWYGGSSATMWYDQVKKSFEKLAKYRDALEYLVNQMNIYLGDVAKATETDWGM